MKFPCPQCGQHLRCNEDDAGGLASCPTCGADVTVPPPTPADATPRLPVDLVEAQHQRYLVKKPIARGGMGLVLAARELSLRRDVAMKVMLNPDRAAREAILRFIEEAQVTGQLEHPGIVPVHELGVAEDGNVFYTMKRIRGMTLKGILEGILAGQKSVVDSCHLGHLLGIFLKACDAVAFAHARGVIHRDLKPENIMVGDFGEVLVVDWGLAKVLRDGTSAEPKEQGGAAAGDPNAVRSVRQQREDNGFQTMDGVAIGTPAYMAPEQASGQNSKVDRRTDIYALGGILYSILTLHPPVAGRDVKQILRNVVSGRVVHPSVYSRRSTRSGGAGGRLSKTQPIILRHCPGRRVPDALAAVALRALARAPRDRYQSVADLQADVESYRTGYATHAEGAGLARLLALFVSRHKGIAAAITLALLLGLGFIAKVVASERRARGHLREAVRLQQAAEHSAEQTTDFLARLQGTAPVFHAQAEAAVRDARFERALQTLSHAISLAPTAAEHYWLKGNIQLALRRIPQARESFEAALDRRGEFPEARDSLQLCVQLTESNGGNSELTPEQLRRLHEHLLGQGRLAEAAAILRVAVPAGSGLLAVWQPIFERTGIKGKLTAGQDGRLDLRVDREVSDLSGLEPLRDVPFGNLSARDCGGLTDIGPLAGFQVRELSLHLTSVSDLSPLRGMRLEFLDVYRTKVADLVPLAGMPLKVLVLGNTRVSDLTPVRGMPLQRLNLSGTAVGDLGPLRGAPLVVLEARCTRIADISPLAGAPLEELDLFEASVSDLSPLKGALLKRLDLGRTPVTTVEVLRGMPLTNLSLYWTKKLRSIAPLEGMPLEILSVRGTAAKDLGVLRGMRLREFVAGQIAGADLGMLHGMPLEILQIDSAPVSDISFVRGMPLRELDLRKCGRLHDLGPLQGCPTLRKVWLPPEPADLAPLRELKNLETINDRPAAEFWEQHPKSP